MFGDGEGLFVAPSSSHSVSVPCYEDGRRTELRVRCVAELSPLDMIDLSNGDADATGHKVWLGALLLCEYLRLEPDLTKWLDGRSVCELGCGTGLGGLAVGAASNAKMVALTDGHQGVIDLAEHNAADNDAALGSTRVVAQRLVWGVDAACVADCANGFDLVLATDAIYDESVVELLFETAVSLLRAPLVSEGGAENASSRRIIIAHVPRTSCDDEVRRRLENASTRAGMPWSWLQARDFPAATGRGAKVDGSILRELVDARAALFFSCTDNQAAT